MANVDVELGDTADAVRILLGCVERGENRGNQDPPSIFMAPRVLRDVSPSSFNPRMVSIGPLHRTDESLQEFQAQKETYLHDLLFRFGFPREQTLKACVQKGTASIDRIRACYAESKTYSDIQLVTMMVLDCCFIIEFLHKLPSLEELFVSMVMKYEPSWFMWVYRPWGKPTVKMPKLYIEDGTELVLRNLIAYEQSSRKVHHYFTSYATAMDMLVDAQEDIEKLVQSEVIVNDLGSNEEAAKMINDICKEVCIIEFFYSQQWKELDSYYKGYWPKNIAWLRRTYFNSPWNAIALLAGIILFALTVVQTVFSIKAV